LTLSLVSCFMTALLSLWVAVPVGYLMSRYRFPGKGLLDAVLDIPIVLPPLVIGLSLLILFQTQAGRFIEHITQHSMGFLVGWVFAPFVIARIAWTALRQIMRLLGASRWESLAARDLLVRWGLVLAMMGAGIVGLWFTGQGQRIEAWAQAQLGGPVTYAVPAVILAQFTVACAFAVRMMRVTFDQISPRSEQVAMTLGCSRRDAFWRVVLPEAWRGMLTAGTMAWARALGEFGPILIFAGATRMRTEVLPTTIFLELSVGNIEAAVAVSILMVICAMAVLLIVRSFGSEFVGKALRP
jgi:molybdate transport system permease protein